MPKLCRVNGNKKEYLVCYTLYNMGFNVHKDSVVKMNHWTGLYNIPPTDQVDITKRLIERFNIKPGFFKINKDNMGRSRKNFTTADIEIYPNDGKETIHLSIKNNNSFLKSPCPNAFSEQAQLDEQTSRKFMKQYLEINNRWYDEIKSGGGKFPQKKNKMINYTLINNLLKSFLITYGARQFIKFILDLSDKNTKYIIKYTKCFIKVYNIDFDIDDYNIHIENVRDTFLLINLEHKKRIEDPVKIKMRIKNYESKIRQKSKVLPIKYSVTLSTKCMKKFECFTLAMEKQHTQY